jgi:hypothetical protein
MSGEPARERSDASGRTLAVLALGIPLLIAVALVVGRQLTLAAPGGGRAAALGEAGRFQHGPDERTSIAEDWAQLDRVEGERLHGYAWVDRRTGTVRIPIDQAMAQLAAGEGPKP